MSTITQSLKDEIKKKQKQMNKLKGPAFMDCHYELKALKEKLENIKRLLKFNPPKA
jgi:hypothetical protein